jgi:hypothetical protein
MAVVLANGRYRVAKRAYPPPQDDHGTPVPGTPGAGGALRDGAAHESPDGSWSLRIDPAEWPVRAGDRFIGPGGTTWTVVGNPRLHRNPAAGDVDYISATGSLDEGPVSVPYVEP